MSLVLSIDLGTSGCRSAVFDQELRMLELSRAEYPLSVLTDRHVEQDAQLWWKAVEDTVGDVTSKLGARRKEIKSIAISSQGISVVPIGRDGTLLGLAISWLDTRAQAETEDLIRRIGRKAFFQHTGKRASAQYTLPKLLWIKRHQPERYEKVSKFLLPMDFIQYRLCGTAVTDHSMAAGTMMYDLKAQGWMTDLLTEYGIERDKLPDLAWAGSPAGTLRPELAERFGLSRDVIVAVGAQDQKCAAHGGGISNKAATVSLGTGSCISKLIPISHNLTNMNIPVFSYLTPDCWDQEGVINTAGSALEWFRNQFASDRHFDELTALAERTRSGNLKFYPYLSGGASPYWGTGQGAFTGMTLKSGLAECTRAILEGVAFHIRANLEAMEQDGNPSTELHIFGGGAKSSLWCQIIADIAQMPVARMESGETALIGAARLAFQAVGEQTRELRQDSTFLPMETGYYDEKYREYEEMRNCCFSRAAETE